MKVHDQMKYRLLYNHDGYCVFGQASPYQKKGEPVGLSQVHGYVDEVADCGCDVLLLSPVISSLPIWPSRVYPHWEEQAGLPPVKEETGMDILYNRVRSFVAAGHDIVQLTADRAHEKGLSFFVSWRMNEMHDLRRGERSPIQSRFWREHPEYRLSGPDSRTLWGRALDFSHEAVRDYKFSLIRELCTRYPVDGLELDFVRFARFFPAGTTHAARVSLLNGFAERVRRMLDTEANGVPLCVRVPNRFDLIEEMGLDLPALVRDGIVQMVNVAPFIVTSPDTEIETFRTALPNAVLYGEITHCTHYGGLIETGLFEERPITREIVLSTAHSFLQRGCDGISIFNYSYARESILGSTCKGSPHEPDFEALRLINVPVFLEQCNKHFVLTDDRYSTQLPVRLNVEDEKHFRLHVSDNLMRIKRAVMRISTDAPLPIAEFEVLIGETVLNPIKVDGELFPVAASDKNRTEKNSENVFQVPINLLRQGWNTFTVRLVSTPMVTIERIELALYCC